MIIRDIFEANAQPFISELRSKLLKLKGVRSTAEDGGDFADTIDAQISIVSAALIAAQDEYRYRTSED